MWWPAGMSDRRRSLRLCAQPPTTRGRSTERGAVMTRPPTAAQRRVIEAADPVTGRLRGTDAQLAALVKRGLAFRHPRPPHDHFLTPAGHRVRETPHAEEAVQEAPAAADSGVFAARVG